jgi:hypothetical protein
MNEFDKTGFAARLKTAAEAKQALLDKLKPKPTVTDPLFAERAAMREAELKQVRADRAEARAVAKAATAAAEQAVVEAQAADEAADLDAKRGARKERKALSKAEAKAKRDARYAARKARQ